MNLKIKQIATIFGIGLLASMLILLVLYALLAQVISDYLVDNIDNYLLLSIIILGLLLLSLVVSTLTTILIVSDVKERSILRSASMSYITTFLITCLISYLAIYIKYPSVFYHINGPEMILNFSQVIVYFSIYCLPHPFYITIVNQVIFLSCFIIYLESYYEEKGLKLKQYPMVHAN